MKARVTYSATAGSPRVRRWYVWHKTGGGWRKERLRVCLDRLNREHNHIAAAAVLAEAVKKGYRV